MKLGIQLYSVRDHLEKDFSATLRAVRDLGCEGVEFAWNYGGMEPEALAAFLREERLLCCGLHASLADLLNPDSVPYRYALAVKTPCITTSCCRKEELTAWPETVATLAKAGTVAAAKGLRFTYHNHAQELAMQDGETLLDRLYRTTPAEAVQAELDVGWVLAGGSDPVESITRYGARMPQVHAKDFSRAEKRVVEVGRGDVDFEGVVKAARNAGVAWLIYELDASTIGDSLDSARESLPRLKALL